MEKQNSGLEINTKQADNMHAYKPTYKMHKIQSSINNSDFECLPSYITQHVFHPNTLPFDQLK